MATRINLRVYRRTQENVVLLWNKDHLTEEQKAKVDILVKKDENIFDHIKFALGTKFEDEEVSMPKDVEMCVIPHFDNNLDMNKAYIFKVILGEKSPIEQVIKVYEYGVLSEDEKDRRTARAHLMLWDEKRKKWRKATGIETKAGFGLLVVTPK
jgi:hypothetical protein